jgi:Rrf2 family protein
MSVKSRFAVAVHILAFIAMQEEKQPLSSSAIAYSVDTNPVFIRRILGLLSRAGLVATQLGVEGGTSLTRLPEEITLLEIYHVMAEDDLFALHHRPPNQLCSCGGNIQPVLTVVFKKAEAAMEATLAETTVADIVQSIKTRLRASYL